MLHLQQIIFNIWRDIMMLFMRRRNHSTVEFVCISLFSQLYNWQVTGPISAQCSHRRSHASIWSKLGGHFSQNHSLAIFSWRNQAIHVQYLGLWKCQKLDLACLQCNVCDKRFIQPQQLKKHNDDNDFFLTFSDSTNISSLSVLCEFCHPSGAKDTKRPIRN